MARMNVNPTRIQLKTLKSRLVVAKRGHKMLKDKCDELIKKYTVLVKQNYSLRKQVESSLKTIFSSFCFAKSYLSTCEVMKHFMLPTKNLSFDFATASLVNVSVPTISTTNKERIDRPYAMLDSNSLFDRPTKELCEVMPQVLRLAEVEKTCQILSFEIEHTKRRVNALEFVMIPQLEETIKYISMKIDEQERTSKIRLLKVKSMIK
ncbi:MAG: V-type ATP synthase subunit D [Christensenellales bacterium]